MRDQSVMGGILVFEDGQAARLLPQGPWCAFLTVSSSRDCDSGFADGMCRVFQQIPNSQKGFVTSKVCKGSHFCPNFEGLALGVRSDVSQLEPSYR